MNLEMIFIFKTSLTLAPEMTPHRSVELDKCNKYTTV